MAKKPTLIEPILERELTNYELYRIRTNGVMTDCKFERDVYYFLKQEMYYISAIVE